MAESPPDVLSEATWEGPPPTLLISTKLETYAFIRTCPHAQTYEAYSKHLRCTVWIPLPCKQWSCRWCAGSKIATLARKCEDAKPNRLLTLTVDPKLWEDPREAFDGTRRKVPELFKKLRTKFGEVEYLKVTELTHRGWPHYHALLRSDYLPHCIVKEFWHDLTGATIVDLRQVKNHFHTYQYLVKYLSKMHTLQWTNRHVSYSRNFFPEHPHQKKDPLQLVEGKILEGHPASLLYHQFRQSTLVEVTYSVFTLNPPADVLDKVSTSGTVPEPEQETATCSAQPTETKSRQWSTKPLPFSGGKSTTSFLPSSNSSEQNHPKFPR